MSNNICLNCSGRDVSTFYAVRDVPVHSTVLLTKRQDALAFPRGDIVLGFCKECGFIQNVAFDPSLLNYSDLYEDQQCFSPTFNVFTQKLANYLIEKYNLRDKEILEIGCGKGDFLILLCELGNNRGVGIDPAYVERIQSKTLDHVTFIKDFYSELYSKYTGNLICCRHTLEHIQKTYDFVKSIRDAIGDRSDTIIFFEVPDTVRILRELAFWDIYYEHCSYFSPGSLARLFRSCNFEVIDMYRGFGDQYLLIEAKPVQSSSGGVHQLEESREDLAKNVSHFSNHCQEKIGQWKKFFQQIHDDGERAIIWGSGSKCVAFITSLGLEGELPHIIDINPHRQGKFLPAIGEDIMPPEFLKKYQPDVTVVMNPIYLKEIKQMLGDMGIATKVVAVE